MVIRLINQQETSPWNGNGFAQEMLNCAHMEILISSYKTMSIRLTRVSLQLKLFFILHFKIDHYVFTIKNTSVQEPLFITFLNGSNYTKVT